MKYSIGIVGAGIMGKGIAERVARYDHDVILYDKNQAIRENCIKQIERNIRVASMFTTEICVEDIIKKIKIVETYKEFSDVDFVIENVTEDINIKEEVYEELEKVCKKECIYIANTSCIPISRLAAMTERPSRVIGGHFMNPVPVKNFVELVKGWHTSEQVVCKVENFLDSLGIDVEVVNDSAGFVSNRVSHLYMNEAMYLVYEKVATAEQVDTIFKKAFGHKMGPLETADLIGLDTVLNSLKILYDEYEDTKYRVCPLLKRMVEAGILGRKSGEGFYKYK